jgi:hypothetical protein
MISGSNRHALFFQFDRGDDGADLHLEDLG